MAMNDPHVVCLRYKLVTGESVSYNAAPPVVFIDPAFELKLAEGVLTAEMTEHHATVGSAMEKVRPAIRAWEIDAALRYGRDALRFEFDSSEVIDRNPSPPGSKTLHALSGTVSLSITGSGKLHAVRREYPAPPTAFKVTPLVELLWNRFQQYLDVNHLLATMGYACLSVIQAEAGGRAKASTQYSIDRDVLDTLGTLTSEVGDELTARKFDATSTRRAHTPVEQNWIVTVANSLICRVAEYEHNPDRPLKQITMGDLPKL